MCFETNQEFSSVDPIEEARNNVVSALEALSDAYVAQVKLDLDNGDFGVASDNLINANEYRNQAENF